MLVHEVMSKDVVTVAPDTTVKHALALLAQHRVTALPVVTADTGLLCGVVSEADLIQDLLASDPRAVEIPRADVRSKPTNVEEIMSGHPVTVRPDTDLVMAVELLTSTAVKSLPVVDRGGPARGRPQPQRHRAPARPCGPGHRAGDRRAACARPVSRTGSSR